MAEKSGGGVRAMRSKLRGRLEEINSEIGRLAPRGKISRGRAERINRLQEEARNIRQRIPRPRGSPF